MKEGNNMKSAYATGQRIEFLRLRPGGECWKKGIIEECRFSITGNCYKVLGDDGQLTFRSETDIRLET